MVKKYLKVMIGVLGYMMIIPNLASADQFRIVDQESGNSIGHIRIQISGNNYYSDSQGRVLIDLPEGEYVAHIRYKSQWYEREINITDTRYMRTIYLD